MYSLKTTRKSYNSGFKKQAILYGDKHSHGTRKQSYRKTEQSEDL